MPIMPRNATGFLVQRQKRSLSRIVANVSPTAVRDTTSPSSASLSDLRPTQKFHRHGRGPRIHDLRHTFAVRTLVNWYRTGKDPAREMIKLTTYLGHANPAHTYWYIEAVPELLDLASQRVEGEVRP